MNCAPTPDAQHSLLTNNASGPFVTSAEGITGEAGGIDELPVHELALEAAKKLALELAKPSS